MSVSENFVQTLTHYVLLIPLSICRQIEFSRRFQKLSSLLFYIYRISQVDVDFNL